VVEGELDWSPATKERIRRAESDVAGVHSGVRCDGCKKLSFAGRRYQCLQCVDYDLCDSCYTGRVVSMNHTADHSLRVIEPPKSGGKAPVLASPALPSYGNGSVVATSLLKSSGQANVYKGHRKARDGSNTAVAIKVYHNEKDWEECKDELMALLKISGHNNVMEVLDFFEKPKPCVTMLLVEGGDLRDYLDKKGKLPSRDAVKVVRGIAQGLLHLHSHKLVHRDLKSPNVLLRLPALEPVLIDLGMGKNLSKDGTQQTGCMKGTLLWMAPEMMTDNSWSVKTDIFALGIIMWECFSGQTPYEDRNFGNVGQLITFIINKEGRPTLSLVSGMSISQSKLMQAAWDTTPANRPTANELLAALA
jgi:serine/threonine protein kinase